MKTIYLGLATGAVLAVVAATAALGMDPPAQDKPAAPVCFRGDMVRNFATRDEEHLYLRVGVKSDVYVFDMIGGCPGLEQADSVSVGTGACLSAPADVMVVFRNGKRLARGSAICHARVVAKLSKEEAAKTLPPGAHP
jgi:hypothetical protein